MKIHLICIHNHEVVQIFDVIYDMKILRMASGKLHHLEEIELTNIDNNLLKLFELTNN